MLKRERYLVLVTRASRCEAWISDDREATENRTVSLMERTIARAEEFTGCYVVGCSSAELKANGNRTFDFFHDGDIMLQSAFDPVAGSVVVQAIESKSRIDKIAQKWFEVYVKNLMNEGKNYTKD